MSGHDDEFSSGVQLTYQSMAGLRRLKRNQGPWFFTGLLHRRTYAVTAIIIVVLLLIFLFASVVPIDRKLQLEPSMTVTVGDYSSLSYLLFGIGIAPFSSVHTYRTTVNGTPIEVIMQENSWNASIGALPLSEAPLADVNLLLLNTTEFPSCPPPCPPLPPPVGSTLLIYLRNVGDSNITLISFTTSFSGLMGEKVSIAPNESQTISFTIYASLAPIVEKTYPISIYGTIVNGSTFRYYTTVEAVNG